jgi:hypothetical protein
MSGGAAPDVGAGASRWARASSASAPASSPPPSPWLFSAAIDLGVFGGSAALALLLLAIGGWVGAGADPATSPQWSWILAVLLCDVAHVWSTAFVVYLDPAEWRRRPWLYGGAPLAAWVGGLVLYRLGGAELFWRVVAYLAAFHFVRQQYGWVMMYRGRAGERDALGRWLDGATIYATTIVPLIVWHTRLPRAFWWMREGDFVSGLPPGSRIASLIASLALIGYLVLGSGYLLRAVVGARRRPVPWGKHLVVITSAVCWYVGIVVCNSDYAFTVTNVFIHGIPYVALIFLYARRAAVRPESSQGLAARVVRRGLGPFLLSLWAVAYLEELLWDRGIWHDHPALFGHGADVGSLAAVVVPLLAVPQLTHYLLDAFLWRRAANPRVRELLR